MAGAASSVDLTISRITVPDDDDDWEPVPTRSSVMSAAPFQVSCLIIH